MENKEEKNKEIWKPLVYYENDGTFVSGLDRFEISNFGNLRNKETHKNYKLCTGKTGYKQLVISLGNGNNKILLEIHRGVMHTFSNFIKNKIVNHIDGEKTNNFIENLEWVTYYENNNHDFGIGLRKVEGYVNGDKIYQFNSIIEVDKCFSKSISSHISDCCKGKRKSAGKHNGMPIVWRYADLAQ